MRGSRPSRAASARSARSAIGVREELLGDLGLLLVPLVAHVAGAALRHELLVAREELLHLHRVVGERLGGGVDGGEAAADRPRSAGAPACWRSSRVRAAPVSCSPMRKSEAVRTPRASPLGMSSTVGLPAPSGERDVVEAHARRRPPAVIVPPKRTPPNSANSARRSTSRRAILRKFLSQRTVMPYSATPPKPAMTRSSSGSRSSSTSRIGRNGTRLPSAATPRESRRRAARS